MMGMFCWHKWKVVEKQVLVSAFEQLAAAGLEEMGRVRGGIFYKPCIVHKRCDKCATEKVDRV